MKRSIYWVDFANNNPHFVNLAGLWMDELGYRLKAYVCIRDGFTECNQYNKSVVRVPFKPLATLGTLARVLMLINICALFVRSLVSAKLKGVEGLVYSSSWRYPKLDKLYMSAAKALNLRVVLLFHEVAHHQSTSSSTIIRSIAASCDVLLAMSEHSRNEIARALDIDRGDIRVTQHPHYGPLFKSVGVDESLKGELERWMDQSPLVLFPSTITSKRGSHFIEGYVDQILADGPDCKLLVIGRNEDAELADRLEACAAGHPEWLKVIARRYSNEELKSALQLATYVALPYVNVMQSGVCPLALGEGVPVVASSIGSFFEVIEPGVNGCLVEMDSLDRLSALFPSEMMAPDVVQVKQSLERHYSGQRFVSDLAIGLKGSQ